MIISLVSGLCSSSVVIVKIMVSVMIVSKVRLLFIRFCRLWVVGLMLVSLIVVGCSVFLLVFLVIVVMIV